VTAPLISGAVKKVMKKSARGIYTRMTLAVTVAIGD
jgi:hypothetical protein